MITVPEVVESVIKKSLYLDEAMSRGIINLSALARMIKPEVEKELMKTVQEGAITMALNRLAQKLAKNRRAKKRLFKNAPDLMVKSGLFEVTVANSDTLIPRIKKMLDEIHLRQNYFLTFTQGIFETTLVLSRNLKDKLLRLLHGEKIVSQFENLSSLTVQLPEGVALIPGAYSYLLKALAWEGINVVEVVSTFNEFSVILEDKDIGQGFAVIKQLLSS